MSYAIKLEHENLLPGSEVITVPGGQFTALVRDEDYTIDYINGIVSILPDGTIPRLPGQGDIDLDITYRRKVDFENNYVLESHIEVLSEVATIVDIDILEVQNSPVRDVQRVLNRTTGEEYSVTSFLEDKIYISGTTLPRIVTLTEQEVALVSRSIVEGKFEGVGSLVLADKYTPAKEHPVSSISLLQAKTAYRQLVRGGIDPLQETYEIDVTDDTRSVELNTGSRILRRSKTVLVADTDYNITTEDNVMSVTLTSSGLAKVGENSLYYRLQKTLPILGNELYDIGNIENSEQRVTFTERYVSEVTTFNTEGNASLTKFSQFIVAGQEVDEIITPTLIVTNQAGTVTYTEGEDYTIDTIFSQLVRVETSANLQPRQVVKVIYADEEDFTATYTIANDVVLIDYDWGSNSLNWSPSYNDTDTQENKDLHEGTRFFRLEKYPANEDVTVYYWLDQYRAQEVIVEEVDITNRRVQVEPVPRTGTYVVEYTARDQTIDPGDNYFVTYDYGARRRALIDNFAALLGLTTGTIYRRETFDFINGQSSVTLSYTLTDIERLNIFFTDDPDEDRQTEPLSFDSSTNVLRFVPVISSGNYTVEYPVVGFETEELRTAIIALLEALVNGPNKRSIEIVCEALTGLTPDIVESIENGFLLTSREDSDYLASLPAQISPALSDGTSSIEYESSRFDTGVALREMNDAWVGYSAISNIRIDEGSISFLTGTFWDGDDEKSHYFVDIRGTDDNTNRLVIYKNKRGSLVFEVHDKNSRLFRVTKDVRWLARNEVHYLNEGDNTVQLDHSPTYTIVDLDGDEQSDLFGAHRTEFVITPSFQGPGDPSLNITTLVRIPNDNDYTDENVHFNAAYKLRTLANIYEKHGAKLTVETESSFMEGCRLYDNVLLELYNRGHGVQLYVEFPQDVITDEAREVYILERRNALVALGIEAGDTDGISGGYEIDHFASVFPVLGFDMATAYRDPLSGDFLENRTAVFRADTGPDFSVPNPDAELVYIPGDVSIQYQKNPMIVQSFIPITDSLLSAVGRALPDVVNSWYFMIGINEFVAAEAALFDQWLGVTVDPLVQARKVAWRTPAEILVLFRTYEKFLDVNRNRVRFITEEYGPYGQYGWGGTQNIRALSWDETTDTLTFDPVDKAGYYLFSYISGFSTYEEAEHLITCTWKLHTTDSQPSMVKMYLDGELVNHKTWGDL